MTLAVVSWPRSQGMREKVARSGSRYMSLSAMRAKPSIEEPSNHLPWSMQSSSWCPGMVTLLTSPTTSVNWRLTKRTRSRSACSSTFCLRVSRLSVLAMGVLPGQLKFYERSLRALRATCKESRHSGSSRSTPPISWMRPMR